MATFFSYFFFHVSVLVRLSQAKCAYNLNQWKESLICFQINFFRPLLNNVVAKRKRLSNFVLYESYVYDFRIYYYYFIFFVNLLTICANIIGSKRRNAASQNQFRKIRNNFRRPTGRIKSIANVSAKPSEQKIGARNFFIRTFLRRQKKMMPSTSFVLVECTER